MYKCTYIPNDHAFVAMKIYYDSNKKKFVLLKKKPEKYGRESIHRDCSITRYKSFGESALHLAAYVCVCITYLENYSSYQLLNKLQDSYLRRNGSSCSFARGSCVSS